MLQLISLATYISDELVSDIVFRMIENLSENKRLDLPPKNPGSLRCFESIKELLTGLS